MRRMQIGMMGIAPAVIGLVILMALSGGLAVSTLVSSGKNLTIEPSDVNITGKPGEIVDIGKEAASEVPWGSLWNSFTSFSWGIISFIAKYAVVFGSWGASLGAGHPVQLPVIFGFVVALLLIVYFGYKKWGTIYEGVLRMFIILAIITVSAILLIILFSYLGSGVH